MNNPAAQAAAFYRSVARNGCVWTLRDGGGYAIPMSEAGRRAQPFWSSRFRALRIVRTVPAYAGLEPVLLSWREFREQWLPGLERDGILVGVNWSGPRALGYDLEPATVIAKCQRAMSSNSRDAARRDGDGGTDDRGGAASRPASGARSSADPTDLSPRSPSGPARIRAAARRLPARSDDELDPLPDRRTAGGPR